MPGVGPAGGTALPTPTVRWQVAGAGRRRPPRAGAPDTGGGDWTFLTNHGHVLLALARDPQVRLRDVADVVGITERSVQAIVADLETAGYITRIRVGRRNVYQLHPHRRFRHPAEAGHRIGELLEIFDDHAGPHPNPRADGRSASDDADDARAG